MRRSHPLISPLLPALAAAIAMFCGSAAWAGKTRNVVLVIADGVRWQEVFTGADPALLGKDAVELRKNYWHDDPNERRRKLFPFLWDTVATHGQIYGNQTKGSVARVANTIWFSYPGYNEMLTGAADPRIDSNEYGPNPNVTVFEWLNKKPAFAGKVGRFGDLGGVRGHLQWRAQRDSGSLGRDTGRCEGSKRARRAVERALSHDHAARRRGPVRFFRARRASRSSALSSAARAVRRLRRHGRLPAHGSLRRLPRDRAFLRRVSSRNCGNSCNPCRVQGRTTLIISTDHGRGSGPTEWRDHGAETKGSDAIWLAVLGPDTPPLGERHDAPEITQAQIAATLAALLGEDIHSFNPVAAPPLREVLANPAEAD